MNCKDLKDHLVLYACAELDSDDSTQVERHLASCACCREELESVRALLGASAPSEVPEMSRQFWDNNAKEIMARARTETGRKPVPRRILPYVLAPIAAAAAVVLFFSVLYQGTDNGVTTDMPAAVIDVSRSVAIEVAFSAEVEQIEEQLDSFWMEDDSSGDRFDSGFNEDLGDIESTIDLMILELEPVRSERSNGSV